jgi:hypothetical protein
MTAIKIVGPSASADLTEYSVQGGNQGRGRCRCVAQRSRMTNIPDHLRRFNDEARRVLGGAPRVSNG